MTSGSFMWSLSVMNSSVSETLQKLSNPQAVEATKRDRERRKREKIKSGMGTCDVCARSCQVWLSLGVELYLLLIIYEIYSAEYFINAYLCVYVHVYLCTCAPV